MFRDRKPTRGDSPANSSATDIGMAAVDSTTKGTAQSSSGSVKEESEEWCTPEITEAIRERRRAHQRYRRQPTEENMIAFKQLRAKARRLIQQSKQDCLERGIIPKARSTYATFGAKFQGSGVGPWPNKGKRVVDSPYNNTKKKAKEQNQGTKAATEDATAYRQKMMITPEPLRKYVEKEVEKIKEALLEALEPLEDGYFPQFYGVAYSKGALVMSCANEQTKRWLERIVPELKPWEGAKLRVKPKGEVAEGTKVEIKTPKLFTKSDPKKILQMLSTQNKTLDTSSWKNVSMTSDDSGQTLVYLVDNPSLEAIRALNNKAYLGLGNVEIVILNNEEDEKQTSVDTEMENEEESDKKTSEDTEMKNEEEGDKKTSADPGIKNEKEANK